MDHAEAHIKALEAAAYHRYVNFRHATSDSGLDEKTIKQDWLSVPDNFKTRTMEWIEQDIDVYISTFKKALSDD